MTENDRWLLVVEDNPDDEHLARRAFALTDRKESLVVAPDGEQALKILGANHPPVLVLMDLKLPRLSGIDVIMAMKDNLRYRAIPIVVLTCSDEVSDIGACYELGCNAFVRKPIDYDDFLTVVSTTLNFWLTVNVTLASSVPGVSGFTTDQYPAYVA